MKKRLVIICLFSLFLMSYGQTNAQTDPPAYNEIKLVSDSWHNLTMENGTGLYFDLIRKVYEPMGIKVSIKIVPYARSVDMVKTGAADAWVASFMNEQPFPLYPKWHFDRNKQMVLYSKSSGTTFSGMKSLENKKVVWLRGFNLDKYLSVKVNLNEIDDISQAFKILDVKRADFFIGAESDIEAKIKEEKIDMSKYTMEFIMYLNLYLAFANNERGKYFCEAWDKQMDSINATPEFRALYNKYNTPIPFEK